tara:strand:- start:38 stop:1063 length:1026 start_codon:yes stop_codon:yes gene_type:complete
MDKIKSIKNITKKKRTTNQFSLKYKTKKKATLPIINSIISVFFFNSKKNKSLPYLFPSNILIDKSKYLQFDKRKIKTIWSSKQPIVNPNLLLILTSSSYEKIFYDLSNWFNLISTQSSKLHQLVEILSSYLPKNKDRYKLKSLFLMDTRYKFNLFEKIEKSFGDIFADFSGHCLGFETECQGLWIRDQQFGLTPFSQNHISYQKMQDIIMNTDILYILGGNPCQFMDLQNSKKTNKLINIIQQRLTSGQMMMIGRSAGTMVMGNSILSSDSGCNLSKNNQYKMGLNLLPNIVIRPHYNPNYIPLIERFLNHEDNKNKQLITLQDDEILLIKNGHISKLKCQ